MHFDTPVQAISNIALIVVCAYAMWRGQATERWGAGLTFAAWTLTPLLQDISRLRDVQLEIFAVDVVYMLGLLVLALRSRRYWPLGAVAFMILEVIMHVAMLVDHQVRARAYFIGMEIWSYLALAALAVGTWLEAPRPLARQV
jgi:hypothetical protein